MASLTDSYLRRQHTVRGPFSWHLSEYASFISYVIEFDNEGGQWFNTDCRAVKRTDNGTDFFFPDNHMVAEFLRLMGVLHANVIESHACNNGEWLVSTDYQWDQGHMP